MVCVQEYPMHLNVDGLRVLPVDFLSPCLPASMVSTLQPIRFEQMTTVLITDCVHTPGDCTRATSRLCVSNHSRVVLAASNPSHLLRTSR